MNFNVPTADQLRQLAEELSLDLDPQVAETLQQYLTPVADGYQYLDTAEDELPRVKYPNRRYRYPETDENRLGAWYVKTGIETSPTGPLQGKRIAIKDNIFVAEVPMMNGASVLEGFIPDFDATVVTRLLDAGAIIEGKAVCEFMCTSGASITASTGIVHNPRKLSHSAGGSSSGSAALVASGDVDMSLGCDQAGSIRIPSSFCGACGLKPTHGLVPYTGIIGMEAMLDHVGPITATVADNALMLEAIAGYDDLDSRQRRLQIHPYRESLEKGAGGLKVALVQEGFDTPFSDPEVDACVREAARRIEALGATVEDVSIPMHLDGLSIYGGVITDGLWETLRLNGQGYNVDGVYSPALHRAMQDWHRKLDRFPVNVLMYLLLGKYLEQYHGKYYVRARNLVRRLRQAYDQVLADYDLLLMPTMVHRAPPIPAELDALTTEQVLEICLKDKILNTCQFDISGHPAMSVPCGLREGLPIGMMLVARHFNEPVIYQLAHAFEQSGDWQTF